MAIFLSNRDGGLTDEQGHYRFQTNVWSGNVIGNGLQVTQNSPLGMSVLVGEGDARIPYSDYAYTPWVDGSETVTIATANPSNPRIDRVVMYIDRSEPRQQVNPNNPGIAKLMAVAGTPGAVPSRPSNVSVQSAVGAGNPYIDLADVRVNAGVTQITNANITRKASSVTPVSSGVKMGILDITSATTYTVSDLPFTPSFLEIQILTDNTTNPNAGATIGYGVASSPSSQIGYSITSRSGTINGSARSTSTTNIISMVEIIANGSRNGFAVGNLTSMSNNSFSINMATLSSVITIVWKVYS